ncbi:unnamed protein product [Cuscuta campestris]|uniref:Uncharacterized protein n=1 Tax=Cuscuta campestris TaxID=132261 RepID=A0A484LG26_9ASTE|nr:unnamed protein product [Cuscuta campestris]
MLFYKTHKKPLKNNGMSKNQRKHYFLNTIVLKGERLRLRHLMVVKRGEVRKARLNQTPFSPLPSVQVNDFDP